MVIALCVVAPQCAPDSGTPEDSSGPDDVLTTTSDLPTTTYPVPQPPVTYPEPTAPPTTVAPTTTAAPTTTVAPTTTEASPLPLGSLDCQAINALSTLAPDPMLTAAGNMTRDALFAAAVGQDVVTLETIFAGEDVVVGALAVGPCLLYTSDAADE